MWVSPLWLSALQLIFIFIFQNINLFDFNRTRGQSSERLLFPESHLHGAAGRTLESNSRANQTHKEHVSFKFILDGLVI